MPRKLARWLKAEDGLKSVVMLFTAKRWAYSGSASPTTVRGSLPMYCRNCFGHFLRRKQKGQDSDWRGGRKSSRNTAATSKVESRPRGGRRSYVSHPWPPPVQQ